MKSESTFTAIVAKDKNGSYTGFIEEVPGAISQGKTVTETNENLQDALKMMLDYYKAKKN